MVGGVLSGVPVNQLASSKGAGGVGLDMESKRGHAQLLFLFVCLRCFQISFAKSSLCLVWSLKALCIYDTSAWMCMCTHVHVYLCECR